MLKGFFKCSDLRSAPDGWSRKREEAFPFPQVKRQKLLGPIVPPQVLVTAETGEDNSSSEEEATVIEGAPTEQGDAGGSDEKVSGFLAEPNHVGVLSTSPGSEKSCLCP